MSSRWERGTHRIDWDTADGLHTAMDDSDQPVQSGASAAIDCAPIF